MNSPGVVCSLAGGKHNLLRCKSIFRAALFFFFLVPLLSAAISGLISE